MNRALLLVLLWFAIPSPGPAAGEPRSAGTPSPPRVFLVGIDGADPGLLEALALEGKLPTFARLLREGAFGPLRSQEPLLSPIVWTTITTGRKPQEHGVLDFVETGGDGRPVPITSVRRRVPALWNVATEFRKTSGFVGWYASYPAEPVLGFSVSDRMAFHQVKTQRAVAGATFPEGLANELRSSFGEPVPDPAATAARFVSGQLSSLSEDGRRRVGELARIHATSEYYRRILPDLAARFRPELLAVYFEGIDACGHLFMEDAPPRRPGVSDSDYAAFSRTVERYYQYQDEVLADLLRLAGPRTVTVVVSDHGFKTGDRRPRLSGRADTGVAPLWHRLHGVVLLAGDGVLAGGRLSDASIYDVAPTIAALLDIPISRELSGHPLAAAFRPSSLPLPRSVARYRPLPPRAAPAPAPADSEALRKLTALGYLGAGPGGSVPHDAEGRTASSYYNEGLLRAQSGEHDAAIQAYGKAFQLDPRNVQALASAAALLIQNGQFDRARELLDRAEKTDPDNFWMRVQRANWFFHQRQLDDAAREIARARAIDDQLPSLHLMSARLESARGRPDRSLEELDSAERLTDLDGMLAEIFVLRAEVLAGVRRWADAEAALARAARYAPAEKLASARSALTHARQADAAERSAAPSRSSDSERRRGESLAAAGSSRAADEALRRAIALADTDEERERAYASLSLSYERRGQEKEVRSLLEDAVRRVPRSHALFGMLGAAYGRAGDYEAAITAYERSVALHPTALGCKTLAALLFEKRGDRPRAVTLWRQSLALDPDQPDVRDFLRRFATARPDRDLFPLDSPSHREYSSRLPEKGRSVCEKVSFPSSHWALSQASQSFARCATGELSIRDTN